MLASADKDIGLLPICEAGHGESTTPYTLTALNMMHDQCHEAMRASIFCKDMAGLLAN